MFIKITTLNGGNQLIRTSKIVRFRPTFGSFEPPNASVIDYKKRIYSADTPATIANKIGTDLPLAELTTPNNLVLFIDAGKVDDIADPIPGHHHPKARSVIGLSGVRAQVRETPNQAKRKIEEALDGSDAPSA
ncbi:MAG: hypothetical protein MPJ78_00580 [Hyphomicrobiaceae bacterium]|nr:hypothetical protein [Hyphomicrobiaceae bacterium]